MKGSLRSRPTGIARLVCCAVLGVAIPMSVDVLSAALLVRLGPDASSVLLAKAGAALVCGAGPAFSFAWLGAVPNTRGQITAAWAFWSLVMFATALWKQTNALGLGWWNAAAVLIAIAPAAWIVMQRRRGARTASAGGARA